MKRGKQFEKALDKGARSPESQWLYKSIIVMSGVEAFHLFCKPGIHKKVDNWMQNITQAFTHRGHIGRVDAFLPNGTPNQNDNEHDLYLNRNAKDYSWNHCAQTTYYTSVGPYNPTGAYTVSHNSFIQDMMKLK